MLCITNNSFKRQLFVFTQLNDQRVLFQTIKFSISHLFVYSLNVKLFGLTDSIIFRRYHSESKWTLEWWQWRSTPHFPNLQDWSFAIRWFNVKSRTLVGLVLPLCSRCILQPQPTGLTTYFTLELLAMYFWGRHLHTKRYFSETSGQVHLPKKRCLINRDTHQHATSKGMNSYR